MQDLITFTAVKDKPDYSNINSYVSEDQIQDAVDFYKAIYAIHGHAMAT